VSNSLKHAFPNNKEGEILITAKKGKDKKYFLMVKDNGIGYPKNLNPRKHKSMGTYILNEAVREINGAMQFNRNKGTKFRITFT
jgi:two-component sensor histidine kinase